MTDYKLVPVEPTPEMRRKAGLTRGADYYTITKVWRAMLAAAPEVQGEPIGYVVPRMAARLGKEELCGISVLAQPEDGHTLPVYLGPQPAEQQPLKSNLALEAATHLTNWLDMNWCECEGGHTCGYNDVKRTRDALLVVAEQQQPVCPTCYGLGWSEDCQNEFRPATCPDCAGSGKAEHSITVQESDSAAPDVVGLVEALECALETMENVDGANDCSRGIDAAEDALAAHRKGDQR